MVADKQNDMVSYAEKIKANVESAQKDMRYWEKRGKLSIDDHNYQDARDALTKAERYKAMLEAYYDVLHSLNRTFDTNVHW